MNDEDGLTLEYFNAVQCSSSITSEPLPGKGNIVSIAKPNAPLANTIEDLGKLGKNITKMDHTVIVGGPGNSLNRNYNYSIEKDINFIAERTANTNTGFVNLFQRHDNP
jgi:hypothetical protein